MPLQLQKNTTPKERPQLLRTGESFFQVTFSMQSLRKWTFAASGQAH